MSYTVECAATVMGPEFSANHSSASVVLVTTFAGGQRGRMVQISTAFDDFACLTMDQLDGLIEVLQHARRESLASHPSQGMDLEQGEAER